MLQGLSALVTISSKDAYTNGRQSPVRPCASANDIVSFTSKHVSCINQPMNRDPASSAPMVRLGRDWRDTQTAESSQLTIGHPIRALLLRHSPSAFTRLGSLGFGFPPTSA